MLDNQQKKHQKMTCLNQLKAQGRSISWLANYLNLSRPTIYLRNQDGKWNDEQIKKLKEIGINVYTEAS